MMKVMWMIYIDIYVYMSRLMWSDRVECGHLDTHKHTLFIYSVASIRTICEPASLTNHTDHHNWRSRSHHGTRSRCRADSPMDRARAHATASHIARISHMCVCICVAAGIVDAPSRLEFNVRAIERKIQRCGKPLFFRGVSSSWPERSDQCELHKSPPRVCGNGGDVYSKRYIQSRTISNLR